MGNPLTSHVECSGCGKIRDFQTISRKLYKIRQYGHS